MADKGKRKRNWASHETQKKPPKWDGIFDQAGKLQEVELKKFLEWFYLWAGDMYSWGQDVRDDIVRLEGHAGFASGDPGDPPDPPPGDE